MGQGPVGLSFIVCCHNSAARLVETLHHLAAQDVPASLRWEVVLVDNASTDRTRDVAASLWPASCPGELRIVTETKLGLRHARERGLAESRGAIVSLIDDDNWVAPDWAARVVAILDAHPEVGACGGCNEAVCEVPAPDWFASHAYCYAVGPQGGPHEPTPGPRAQLWGAGLTVRREAWDALNRNGFNPLLSGRQGAKLTAGEDSELCLALRLAGWQLWYDPALRLRHFLPANRLRWTYLRGLVRGFGATLLDPYWFEVDERLRALPAWRRSGLMLLLREIRSLPHWLPGWWAGRGGGGEGDPRVLHADRTLARCAALLDGLGDIAERARKIREAPWRSAHPRGSSPPPV